MVKRKVARKTRTHISQPDTTTVVIGSPVVLKVRKKKRGSSHSARRLEDIEKRLSKAVRRVSRGVKNGVDTYIDHRDRSERRRRDGALVDFCENTARGTARAISESSPVLTDIARAWNTRKLRKQMRKAIRTLPMFG
ncbi:MAG: hypothetical protein QOC99_1337 [Acidobacteriota bacterium]|jgi:hypothetical protein|nr:hypothetical protein [Acidobacteriota bacterium]MDT7778825.1 hypothetical protein [Acidobacteriota bacterium]